VDVSVLTERGCPLLALVALRKGGASMDIQRLSSAINEMEDFSNKG
jgi:hypothetical protein